MKRNFVRQYKLDSYYNYYCYAHTLKGSKIHSHMYYEMEVILSGSGTNTINSVPYKLRRGEIHFLRLTDFHEINLSEKAEIITLQIAPHYLPDSILNIMSSTPGELVAYLSEEDTQFFEVLCKKAYVEIVDKSGINEELLHYLFMSAIYIFLSRFKDTHNINQMKSYDDKINKIVAYIHKHYKEGITLNHIAKEFFLNKNYLCTYFKKHMGMSVLDYIKETRLGYALNLAISYNLKNEDLCNKCGYGSVANFLRDFKRKYGCSPLQMRKNKKM